MAFIQDHRDGRQAEDYILYLLRSGGMKATRCKDRADECKDLEVVVDGRWLSVEVKFDKMAAKTGNLAIEYYKPIKKSDSGLAATTADLWVYVLRYPLSAYIIPVQELKQFVSNTNPAKIMERVGDGNASILLYKLDVILPHFYSLSETSSKERKNLLRNMRQKL